MRSKKLLERLRAGPPATAKELESHLDAEPGELSNMLAYYRNNGLIDRDMVISEQPGQRPTSIGIWRAIG